MVSKSKKQSKLKEISDNYKSFQTHPSKQKMTTGIINGLILFGVGVIILWLISGPIGYLGAYVIWGVSFVNIQSGISLFMSRMEIDTHFRKESKKILDDLGIEVEK